MNLRMWGTKPNLGTEQGGQGKKSWEMAVSRGVGQFFIDVPRVLVPGECFCVSPLSVLVFRQQRQENLPTHPHSVLKTYSTTYTSFGFGSRMPKFSFFLPARG